MVAKPMADGWPLYFKDQVTVGNLDSNVGVVTLWTRRDLITKQLASDTYACVGQLYSKNEGINAIIRNCLANKRIRHLVVLGQDLNGSGEVLLKLWRDGDATIKDETVEKEIPDSAFDNLRKNVTIHDMRSAKLTEISALNDALQSMKGEAYGDAETFPVAQVKAPDVFPSEHTGIVVRDHNIGDAWIRILHTVLRFGTVKPSQYEQPQKEIVDLVAVVEEEDPTNPIWQPYYIFTREQLASYIPQVTTGQPLEGVKYTYGQRLHTHFGVDQIENIVSILGRAPSSRRAVAATWDVRMDTNPDSSKVEPPCLDMVQALINDGKLYFTAYFRSNDMFGAWPANAYALRSLQKKIADRLNIPMGPLTTVSCSAHIYQSDWERAKKIVAENEDASNVTRVGDHRGKDPRGNLIIRVEDDLIKITHLNPEGGKLDTYEGKTAIEINRQLAINRTISDAFHMLDVGAELMKAEIALRLGKKYVQDQPLDLK